MTRPTRTSTLAGAASAAGFALTMLALQRAGGGALAAPPAASLPAIARWVDDRDPLTVAMALLRLLALGLGYHLVATSALAAVGRALRAPHVVGFADRITLPIFRSTAARLAGLLLSASTFAAGALPSASASPPAITTVDPTGADGAAEMVIQRVALTPEPASASGSGSGWGSTDEPSGTATIRVVPEEAPTAPAVPVAAAAAPVLHHVVPGDHLWRIAEDALASAWGRAPGDSEIDPFWRQVIAANPGIADPDLIFPGQLVVVPPVPRQPV